MRRAANPLDDLQLRGGAPDQSLPLQFLFKVGFDHRIALEIVLRHQLPHVVALFLAIEPFGGGDVERGQRELVALHRFAHGFPDRSQFAQLIGEVIAGPGPLDGLFEAQVVAQRLGQRFDQFDAGHGDQDIAKPDGEFPFEQDTGLVEPVGLEQDGNQDALDIHALDPLFAGIQPDQLPIEANRFRILFRHLIELGNGEQFGVLPSRELETRGQAPGLFPDLSQPRVPFIGLRLAPGHGLLKLFRQLFLLVEEVLQDPRGLFRLGQGRPGQARQNHGEKNRFGQFRDSSPHPHAPQDRDFNARKRKAFTACDDRITAIL